MASLNSSDEAQRKPKRSQDKSKNRKRASKACRRCRARKVRCDVSYRSRPCTNCFLDGETCLVPERASRGSRTDLSLRETILQACRLPDSPENAKDAGDDSSSPSTEDRPTPPSAAKEMLRLSAEPSEQKLVPEPLALLPDLETGVFDLEDGLTLHGSSSNREANQVNSRPSADQQEPSRPWQVDIQSRVAYSCYPFVVMNNCSNLPSQDLSFLELQGCLHMPAQKLLDEFLQQYFLHVHPLMPLVNEDDFWELYYPRNKPLEPPGPPERMPLLVVQAMLFASCNLVSHSTIAALGYPSMRAARCDFYRRARLLYDLETEVSPLHLAQAALLLSMRAPPCNRSPDTWLSFAIHHARSAEAHRYASLPVFLCGGQSQRHPKSNLLKKIWWSCIIRDRTLSLLMRRPVQIVGSYIDSSPGSLLCASDFEHEFEHSRVYNSETKRALAGILAKQVELYSILTKVLMVVYPPDVGLISRERSSAAGDQSCIRECKALLRQWYKSATLRFPPPGAPYRSKRARTPKSRHHDSEILYTNLMFMFYHASCVTLSHHDILQLLIAPSGAQSSGMGGVTLGQGLSIIYQNRRELENAISGLTERVVELVRLDLARWLPISAVACIALPLFLNILDIKLSDGAKDSASAGDASSLLKQRRLHALIELMRIYHPQYDDIDWVSKIIKHVIGLAAANDLAFHADHEVHVREWADILSLQPSLYLGLMLVIDVSFSKERVPEEADLPMMLRNLLKGGAESKSGDPGTAVPIVLTVKPGSEDAGSYVSSQELWADNVPRDSIQTIQPDMANCDDLIADKVDSGILFAARSPSSFTWDGEPEGIKWALEIEPSLVEEEPDDGDRMITDDAAAAIPSEPLETLWGETCDGGGELEEAMACVLTSSALEDVNQG